MLERFEVHGVHAPVDDNLKRYAAKKIGNLDKYLSRHYKDSAHCEVILKESKAKDKKQCTCEVNLHLPKETINIKESTINMYASIDVVEAKLKLLLKKYKDTRVSGKLRRRLTARLSRQSA